jgi:hypothetical protein
VTIAHAIVVGVEAYALVGIGFALLFVVFGIARVLPGAGHVTPGARIMILPAAAGLWPWLMLRWFNPGAEA